MVSLKDCDYKQYLDIQPVSKPFLKSLRDKALAGDLKSDELFKKHIYSLAVYIAQMYICEYMDLDYLLQHINAEGLELLSQTNLFFYFHDNDSHIHAFQAEISNIIDRIYITTQDGKLIAKEQYEIVKKSRKRNKSSKETAEPLIDGIPEKVILAVHDNEKRIKRKEALERRQFYKLKQIIRDHNNLSYQVKYHLLCYLLKDKTMRGFFYCVFGVNDGVVKSPEEAAYCCGLNPEIAVEIYTRHTDVSLITRISRMHKCTNTIDREEQRIIDFLCENEQNRKERDIYQEELNRNRLPMRRYKLRDYLD